MGAACLRPRLKIVLLYHPDRHRAALTRTILFLTRVLCGNVLGEREALSQKTRGQNPMMKLTVGTYESSGKQVVVDVESRDIVQGVVENGVVKLQSGERVKIEDGRVTGEA